MDRSTHLLLMEHIKEAKLPMPILEHTFASPRRWRFDFAWPEYKIALEIEGGIWKYGRHNRAASMIADMEKYNAATILDWQLLRYPTEQVLDGTAIKGLVELFKRTMQCLKDLPKKENDK